MKTRKLTNEEKLIWNKTSGQEEIFLGTCHGVILHQRGRDDPHICFTIITEDDGHWFHSETGGSSAYWLPELIEIPGEVHAWLVKYAENDHVGWKFKTQEN